MLDNIIAFFTSPTWLKVVFLGFIVWYANYLRSRRNNPAYPVFSAIGLILMIRDVLFYVTEITDIIYMGDLLMLTGYLYILQMYTKDYKTYKIIYGLNGFLVLFLLANTLFLNINPILMSNLPQIGMLISIILLGIMMHRISEHNTENADIILVVRNEFIAVQLVFHIVFFLIDDFKLGWVHAILFPMFYLIHLHILHTYHRAIVIEETETARFLHSNVDSIFDFMRTIGNAISEKVEIDRVLEFVAYSAVKDTSADAGAILLVDDFEDLLRVKAVCGNFPPPYQIPSKVMAKNDSIQKYLWSTPIKLGDTVLGEAAVSGKPIFIPNSTLDERLKNNCKTDALFISSMIVIPLIVNKKVLGVLAITSKNVTKPLDERNFEHMRTFADYTSLTINNLYNYMQLLEKQEMEREVGIAAEIQGQLLPKKLPKIKNAKISAFSRPAKGVSGDYYDVIRIKRGQIALVICDVAGKGVPASLVMVMIRTIIHLVAGAGKDAAYIVNLINRGIAGRIALDRFATLSFMIYDPETKVLEYSNAAHHPLMVYRAATGTIESADTEGIPIGLEKTTKYGKKTIQLEENDIIILYTDGINEAMNIKNEQYSYERLEKLVKKYYTLSADDLSKKILDDLAEFVGNAQQHDDQTLLITKIT